MLRNSCLAQHTFGQSSMNSDERLCELFLNSIEFTVCKTPDVHIYTRSYYTKHLSSSSCVNSAPGLRQSFIIDQDQVSLLSPMTLGSVVVLGRWMSFWCSSYHIFFQVSAVIPRLMIIWRECRIFHHRPCDEQTQKDIFEICLP